MEHAYYILFENVLQYCIDLTFVREKITSKIDLFIAVLLLRVTNKMNFLKNVL